MPTKYRLERLVSQVPKIDGEIPDTAVFGATASHHAKRFSDTMGFNFYDSISKHDFDEDILCYVKMFPNEIAHLMRMNFRNIRIVAMFIGSDIMMLQAMDQSNDSLNKKYFNKYKEILNCDNVAVVPVFDNLAIELEHFGIKSDGVVTLVPPKKTKYWETPQGKSVGIYLPEGRVKALHQFNWNSLLPVVKDKRFKFSILGNIGMYRAFGLDKLDNCRNFEDFDKWLKTININIRLTDHDGFPQSVVAATRNGIPTITSAASAHFNISKDTYYILRTTREDHTKRDAIEIKMDVIDRLHTREAYYNEIDWKSVKQMYRVGYFSPDRMAYDFYSVSKSLLGG